MVHAENPATGEQLEPGYRCETIDSVESIARLAADAFEIYRQTSGADKAALLRKIADNIDAAEEEIVARMQAESGLPEGRCRGEKGRTVGQLRMFAELVEEGSWVDARIETAMPDRAPLPKPDLRSMARPLGPVVVFCASNFPLAFSVAGGDVASALAAGCPVIVKAHLGHPGTAELVGQAVQAAVTECGLPDGTFALVYEEGIEVGSALVAHREVKAVGFTGSRQGGRALMDIAAARKEPIPVYAEMSAINPVFFLPEIMKSKGEALAEAFAGSLTLGVGQFCTNPGLVFCLKDQVEDFAQAVSKAAAAVEPATMLNSRICQNYRENRERLESLPGVSKVLKVEGPEGSCNEGAGVYVTSVEDYLENPLMWEEVFGPTTLIVAGSTVKELRDAAQALEGQLTATVHGTDEEIAASADLFSILERKAGRLIVNGFPTGVEVCHSMVHGGPYPATSDGRTTSVGSMAIGRFARPVSWQSFPDASLPDELKNANPLGIWRMVNGERVQGTIA